MLLLLVVIQDQGLSAIEFSCRLLTQPMAYSVKHEKLLRVEGAEAKPAIDALAMSDAQLVEVSQERLANLLGCKVSAQIVFPKILSAPPWHYEALSDGGGPKILLETLTDGVVETSRVRHSDGHQCNISFARNVERVSVSFLAQPLPSREFIEGWFTDWQWARIPDAASASWVATRSGVPARYLVTVNANGLVSRCVRVNSGGSAGEIGCYTYSVETKKCSWLECMTRISWNESGVYVDRFHVGNAAMIGQSAFDGLRIALSTGDMVCDARVRPYVVHTILVGDDQKINNMPFVRLGKQ